VQQNQVVQGVSAPFYPLADLVYMLIIFFAQHLTTDQTLSLLFRPQPEQPSFPLEVFYHSVFEPVFDVEFPLRVIRVCRHFDFAMSFDGSCRR
jgi:hypothetical protein